MRHTLYRIIPLAWMLMSVAVVSEVRAGTAQEADTGLEYRGSDAGTVALESAPQGGDAQTDENTQALQTEEQGGEAQADEKSDDAQAPEIRSRLLGDWPDRMPNVTLKLSNGTVGQALQTIAKQARLGLVLDVPEQLLEKRMTLILVRKPAREVLEIVLESSGLYAELKSGIVFIRVEDESRPATRGDDKDKEADTDDGDSDTTISIGPSLSFQIDGDKGHGNIRVKTSNRHGKKERVEIGKSVRVEADEDVGDAVSVGGSVTVLGRVRGDAVSVGGSVYLKDGARVDGDAVSVGGTVDVSPKATLKGDRVGVGIPFPGMGHIAEGVGDVCVFGPFSTVLMALIIFFAALLTHWIAPKRIIAVKEYMTGRPGFSTLGGLALFVGFFIGLIVLIVTIIGWLLIPFWILGLALLMLFGNTVILTWVGHAIPLFKGKKGQVGAMLLGTVLFFLISLIPFGKLILFVAAFIGAGATLLSRIGAEAEESAI